MADENDTNDKDMKELLGTLKDIQSHLQKSATATQTPPVGNPASPGKSAEASEIDRYEKVAALRTNLLETYDTRTLHRMIGLQMRKGTADGMGVPFESWADRSTLSALPPEVTKLLDTAGGVAMIRQDLEPLMYAAFVKSFPWFDRIGRKPSNGLVHAYNRIDALPTADFISDTGAVTDKTSTYTRATTNIAIAALRVGTSLRVQFAVRAGGAGFDPEQEEIRNALTAIAKKMQSTMFQGNDSVPGKLASDPEGLFDPLSFNGLRIQIPSANTLAVETTSSMLEKFNKADAFLSVTGGKGSIILMDGRDRIKLMNELQPNVRYVDKMPIVPGLPSVEAINLGNSGMVPVLAIPGDEIGSYSDGAGHTVRDAYLLDESTIGAPWLGSESPTVLEIPVGVSGTLTKLYIVFMMMGMEMAVPKFNAKVRLDTA